jgi:hypothetical protein
MQTLERFPVSVMLLRNCVKNAQIRLSRYLWNSALCVTGVKVMFFKPREEKFNSNYPDNVTFGS